jgi:hypothetical protein
MYLKWSLEYSQRKSHQPFIVKHYLLLTETEELSWILYSNCLLLSQVSLPQEEEGTVSSTDLQTR